MIIAGVDYSMTSPSVCVFDGKRGFAYKNCNFFFLTDKNKLDISLLNMEGRLIEDYTSSEERFNFISDWAINTIVDAKAAIVYIEGYAYAGTGRVFQIAENTGLLKHKLWTSGVKFSTVPPTEVKKFATGKGNSNKEAMQEAFLKETGVDIKKTLGLTPKQWNPSSDIIDSYYICKYGYDHTPL